MTNSEAVALVLKGSPRDPVTEALARSLAEAMDEAPSASVARELRILLNQTEPDDASGGGILDDLAARRAQREAG